jgi:D-glycero-D-manno-heptose 1,7-bisphosphate phosphatase
MQSNAKGRVDIGRFESGSSGQARAVFLDRDGILLEDADLLVSVDQVHPYQEAISALKCLKDAHYALVVVTNQPVVARGLATERDVEAVHAWVGRFFEGSGVSIDRFYYCPHHPKANVPAYRMACECRKPGAGMLLKASSEMGLDLTASYMIGDRISDVIAGKRAGCRTVLVQTGKHLAPPIEFVDQASLAIAPDYTCANLTEAVEFILRDSDIREPP